MTERGGTGTPTIRIDVPARLAETFGRLCEGWGREAVELRGRFVLGVPGGSVGTLFIPSLVQASLPWRETHLFWVDERLVPVAEEESNAGSALRLLRTLQLEVLPHVHPMYDGESTARDATTAYARILEGVAGAPPRFDVALLGVGEDGHVCSLFPGSSALDEEREWVVAVHGAPKPPPDRLTVTMPVLRAARRIVVAAFGDSKARVIEQALRDRDSDLPIARVLRQASEAWLWLDSRAAAGALDLIQPAATS